MARYRYDPLGRRVQKITAAGTTTYTYAGMDILQEKLNGVVTATYVHGPRIDEPLAKLDLHVGFPPNESDEFLKGLSLPLPQ